MTKRAASAAATRQRVLDAATVAMRTQFRPDVRLDAIADASGVSVQTVLRIFGTRQGLLDEVVAAAAGDVGAEFADVEPGDVDGVVAAYLRHYEKAGDLVVRNIQDEADPDIARFVARGRAAHRARVRTSFAPYLEHLEDGAREQLVDLLVAALDVYVWKLFRRDLGRDPAQVSALVTTMVRSVLEAPR